MLQWQFRTLAFGLFGIQYLIRVAAIHKVKKFMEDLISRNSASTIVGMSRDNFRQMTEVTCAVPLYSASISSPSASSLPGYNDLNIQEGLRITPNPNPEFSMINYSNDSSSGEQCGESSRVPSYEEQEQDKLPSYSEAIESLSRDISYPNPDPPPSYSEVVPEPIRISTAPFRAGYRYD